MKSQGIWEAKQAPFKRALQRHVTPARWDRFVAEASKIDRTAKGRGDGDAWVGLERLLLAIADAKAVRLLVA
jgi:DNA polymerase-3 subunit delta